MDLTAPAPDVVEVSIVGRGYGETVLVHLGFGDWLLIDSCVIEPDPPTPFAPYYLHQIGVPFERVRWLLASHWHDDHVAGFSATVRLCAAAEVFMSDAMRSEEFASLALALNVEPPGKISSGLREMRATLKELRASRRIVQQASANQRLYYDTGHGVEREIWALSPSNAASFRAKQAFAQSTLPVAVSGRRVAAPSPNETSVALWVRVGDVVVLLGADLENAKASDRGWKAVLSSAGRPTEKASLYKVAHHGADNGDHPDIWTVLLDADVVAALTPYGAGRRPRPELADVQRICGHTPNAYIAGPEKVKLPRASSPVEKVRRRATKSASVSERPFGQIRCRSSHAATSWVVELDGTAKRLCA